MVSLCGLVWAFVRRWKRWVWPLVPALALLHRWSVVVAADVCATQREMMARAERQQRKDAHDALIYAAFLGDLGTVRKIASEDPFLNRKGFSQSMTPLHAATQEKRVAVVRFLLSKGADVYAPNASGETSLAIANRKGYTEIITMLLADEGRREQLHSPPKTRVGGNRS